MSDMQKFNPQTIAQTIEERIKQNFVELIPDEAFKAMVQQSIDRFAVRKFEYGKEQPSGLDKLIDAEVEKRLREIVKAELDKDEYRSTWDHANNTEHAGDYVAKVLRESAPAMIEMMFAGMAQRVVSMIRSDAMR